MNNQLVLLKVVNPVDRSSLDHVATSKLTGNEVWKELINGGHPELTRSLHVVVPGRRFNLRLLTYRNSGGITNKQFRIWLHLHNFLQPGTLLLFDVLVDEEHNVTYEFKGKLVSEL